MNKIILVGVGRMGAAMLQGWIESLGQGFSFVGIDPHPAIDKAILIKQAADNPHVDFHSSIEDMPDSGPAAAIVLATKPQHIAKALVDVATFIDVNTLVISVAAGVTLGTLKQNCPPGQPVIRAMPNIGAMVGKSATAACASEDVDQEGRNLAEMLFNAIGRLTWLVDESDLHTVTAVSGSGPAYFFAMCEAMITAAVTAGLPIEISTALVLDTISASGRLLDETPDPAKLRETVTSPNGTTAAGLAALSKNAKLNSMVAEAIKAARQRSTELSG
ncbi:MAG: pyrroline-5-carboxylate reductase [Blastopirellula sp.]|nr:MAG: pyrroline-5-carboxylate reductase [Blastopirellula sp.]